jgi:molecular chaperone GrpE
MEKRYRISLANISRLNRPINQVKNLEKKQTQEGYEAMYLRLLADFENYKKRNIEMQANEKKYANEDLLIDFLPTLELLNSAVNSNVSDPNISAYLQGFKMISDNIFNALESNGVKRISQINKFDPKIHEAIQMDWDETKKEDDILKVISNGYTLNGKVIIYAKVKINKKNKGDKDE